MKLFDDALAVCEEVCLEICCPVIEALQNHKPAQPMDALIAGKDIASSVFESCQPRDETDNLEEFSLTSDKNNIHEKACIRQRARGRAISLEDLS